MGFNQEPLLPLLTQEGNVGGWGQAPKTPLPKETRLDQRGFLTQKESALQSREQHLFTDLVQHLPPGCSEISYLLTLSIFHKLLMIATFSSQGAPEK